MLKQLIPCNHHTLNFLYFLSWISAVTVINLFGGSWRSRFHGFLEKNKIRTHNEPEHAYYKKNAIHVTWAFSPPHFQWNSQVLNESLPSGTHKVTPPPVPSPPKPLAQQSEVPTPSILSAPYQLCQAFNLPGDIPGFPAWDRGRDKHASLRGKSLHTPTRSLIPPSFN